MVSSFSSLHHWHLKLARGSSEILSSDLFSAYPTLSDFQITGKQIIVCSSRSDRKRTRFGTVERLSSVLSSHTLILSNTIISDPRYNYYYSLRDYYGLVKFSRRNYPNAAAKGMAPETLQASSVMFRIVRWALVRNLSTWPPDPRQAHLDRFQRDLVDAVQEGL